MSSIKAWVDHFHDGTLRLLQVLSKSDISIYMLPRYQTWPPCNFGAQLFGMNLLKVVRPDTLSDDKSAVARLARIQKAAIACAHSCHLVLIGGK